METSIKLDTDGWFEIRTTEEVSLEWRNRFNAPMNRRKIIAWTQDNHVRTNLLVKEGQYFLEMCYKIEECRKTTISSLQKLFHELVDFVDNLPEVDAIPENDNDYQLEEDRKFVRKMIEIWDKTDTRLGTSGALIFGSDSELGLEIPVCRINEHLLKQMFEAWLKEYDK